MRAGRPALAAILALSACSGGQPEGGNRAVPVQGIEAPANVVANSAAAPSRCAPVLTPQLDRESIVAVPADANVDRARLDSLAERAGAAFDAAAERLCDNGKLDPKLLRPFRTLIIQNGSGATEATFYEDPHEFSGEDLIFQWIFAESDLAVPLADDVEAGLLCWAKPNLSECADREP